MLRRPIARVDYLDLILILWGGMPFPDAKAPNPKGKLPVFAFDFVGRISFSDPKGKLP